MRKSIAALLLSIGCAAPSLAMAQTAAEPALSSAPTAAAAPVTRHPSQYSAVDFAQLPFVEDVEISPNGERVAGMMAGQGMQLITVFNLFDKTEKRFAMRIPDGTEARWIRWVNDDNIIVGLTALQPFQGDRIYISRMVAVNRVSGKLTRLLWDSVGQQASNVLWTASDGTPELLVSAQMSLFSYDGFWPTVFRVNVENGRRRVAEGPREDVMNWYADANGQVRTGIGYNDTNRTFRLIYRAAGEKAMRTIDRADTRKGETLLYPFHYLPGGNNALAMHDDDKGMTAVYEVDVLTQKDIATRFAAPAGHEVTGIRMSYDGATVLGYGTTENHGKVHWQDPAMAEIQAALDKSVPDRRIQILSTSRDRSRMLVLVDRADTPGALYFFSTADPRLQRIAAINEALGTRPLSPVKTVRYKARDGLEIEAVLTLPKGKPGSKLPVVVMPHGGPWAQDTADYDYWAQFIASRGYAVIQPNFRGSTGYGTEFLKAGEGQMGLAMQDDLNDALKWLVDQGIADPKRACIVGASYGGYAAMWGVARDPDLYRCAISIAGVANLRREVNDFGGYRMGNKFQDDWKKMTPDFVAVSPIFKVDRIKAPLLLVHGKKDVTVDVGQSDAMNSKMRGAGKQVEYLQLPEADHHFTRQADREALLGAIESFLAKHNPAS